MAVDVIVVGGGIVGASIAFQIRRRTDIHVLVLDKAAGPAEGSTGASSSISRCRYTHPEVVRLALHGQRAFRSWAEFTGLEDPRSEYRETGLLWLIDGAVTDARRLAAGGVEVDVLDPGELRAMFPSLSDCRAKFDLTGEDPHTCRPFDEVLFEPSAGYADPAGACADLIEAARLHGAEVRFGATVTDVITAGERVEGVGLASGERIRAGTVINASGPWCNQLNRLAGCQLRWTLEPTRVQTLYRSWPGDLGPLPIVVDGSTGIYLRPDGPRLLFGSILPEDEDEFVADPDHFSTSADTSFRDSKIHALHHRIPDLEHRGAVTGIAGLYTINREDVHPVVGPTEVDGWWVANGFSGHGFKLAPMIGSLVARAMTGVEAAFDTDVSLDLFAFDRDPIGVSTKHVLA